MHFWSFLKEGGEFSYARVIGFLAFLVCVAIAVCLFMSTRAFTEIPTTWGALVIAPYAIGKTAEVFMARGAQNGKPSV